MEGPKDSCRGCIHNVRDGPGEDLRVVGQNDGKCVNWYLKMNEVRW